MKPWFPFYVNDWLSSPKIATMTAEEEGAYIRLLCYDWANDGIPNDPEQLAVLSRLGQGWFKGGSRVVERCFKPHPTKDGFMTNQRLHEERLKTEQWTEKCRNGGRKSAEGRHLNPFKGSSRVVEGYLKLSQSQSQSQSQDTEHTHQGPSDPPARSHDGDRGHASESVKQSLRDGLRKIREEGAADAAMCDKVEAETGQKVGIRQRPDPANAELLAAKIGLPNSEVQAFFDYYDSNGWKVGRNPMRSWQGAMRNWKRNWEQRRSGPSRGTINAPNKVTETLAESEERRTVARLRAMAGAQP